MKTPRSTPVWRIAVLVLALGFGSALAQSTAPAPDAPLTLAEAQRIALRNRPALRAREWAAEGARQVRLQVAANRYPQIGGNITAATARRTTEIQNGREVALDTRIAAGGLNNPTILRRDAVGITVSQLLTDFGRTSDLIESAALGEQSQRQQVNATRDRILLQVASNYLAVLEAQSVVRVARKTVDARTVLLERIGALAKSRLKAELDVRFAQVALDEARLLQLRAENGLEAARAGLSTSLGFRDARRFALQEPPEASVMPDLDAVLRVALASRPDLASLRAERDAALRFADAQGGLRMPTVSAFAAAGAVPVRDERLPPSYGAIGVNLSMPLFDGGKISALQEEARVRARAAAETLTEAENTVTEAVRVAWLNAGAARENIGIAAHMQEAAADALKLAEARYGLGITSIVELNQAQLSAIDAEIAFSRARYAYLRARAALDYETGRTDLPADR